jgi:DHA3 family macrolide efflux protein-like MFS transporter
MGRRAFALLWSGQVVSLTGSGAATFALSTAVYAATGQAAALALVLAAKFVTSIYLAPLAGAVADHFPRRGVIITCDVALACCALVLAALATSLTPGVIGAIIAVVALSGLVDAALSVSLSASVRQLRGEADLTKVNGMVSFVENLPAFAGPVLGAAVYSFASPSLVFLFDAVSFTVAACLALAARWDSAPAGPKRPLRPFAGAAAGVRYVLRDRRFRRLQLSFAWNNFFNGMGAAVLTAFVLTAAENPEWNLALYTIASSAGLLLGASAVVLLAGRVPRRFLIGGGVLAGGLVGRVALVATALPWAWAVSGCARNIAVQMTNAPLTAIWQERVPPERQGTVFGARRLLGQGPYPVAVLLGGLLTDHLVSAATLLLLLGVAEIVVGLALLAGRAVAELSEAPAETPAQASAPSR